jgi:hypothetical protein
MLATAMGSALGTTIALARSAVLMGLTNARTLAPVTQQMVIVSWF